MRLEPSPVRRGLFVSVRRLLHRYLAEYDLRYNNHSANGVEDQARARLALEGIKGKRLMYEQPNGSGDTNWHVKLKCGGELSAC